MGKICRCCLVEKELVEFSNRKASTDGKSSRCLLCTRIYTKDHYSKNKDYYHNKNKRQRKNNREFIWDILKNSECKDCGNKNPLLLEFDHLSDKIGNVSEMINGHSKESLLNEISKCEIVCANCHKMRTYKRSNTWQYNQWLELKGV